MVHWGQSEIQAQLGRIQTIAENGKDSRDAGWITPKAQHKFQAERDSLQDLFSSMNSKAKLLADTNAVAHLWNEKANEDKFDKSKTNKLKEFQMKFSWCGIIDSVESDLNYCNMCRARIERYRKRSSSM